jgi:hypothetical protein
MFPEQHDEFLLEGTCLVMLLLPGDVLIHRLAPRTANTESRIALLPTELFVVRELPPNPSRGITFDDPQDLGQRAVRRNREQKVYMIGRAVDDVD